MVLLIDANVILDYFLVRRSHFKNAQRLLSLCQTPSVKGYVAFHSIPIIDYTLRNYPLKERRKALSEITDLLTVTAASHNAVVDEIDNEKFPDLEDCLQEKCALEVDADYIVTRNVKDFETSQVKAVTPAEMLEIICNS